MRFFFITFLILFASPLRASPVASFTASPSQGCSPLVVKFTNQSTGAVSYEWDFGNGNKSTLTEPSAIYYIPGYYTVKLTAFDGKGGQHEVTKSNIRVFKDPKASFSVTRKDICAGEEIVFISTSVKGDTGLAILSWDFGDGTLRTGDNIKHVYTQSGLYTIALHIQDLNGCTSDTIMSKLITVKERPKADYTVDYNSFCSYPAKVNFTNKSTLSKPHSYFWEFGDGGTSTSENPSHDYTKYGVFKPRIIVTGNSGCRDTFQGTPVSVVKLAADFSVPSDLCGPGDFTFADRTIPALSGMSYQWELDGQSVGTSNPLILNLGPGTYKLKFNIYNSQCFDAIEKTIAIKPKPSGTISLNPKYVCKVPQKIDLSFSPANYDSYDWKVNGTTVGGGNSISYTEKLTANSTISLVVSNKGCLATIIDTAIYSKPSVKITPRDTSGCVGMTVTFNSKVTTKYPITDYTWIFGDGDSSKLKDPSHQFNDSGLFIPVLIVTNEKGCKDSTTDTIRVGVKIPPKFDYDTSSICNGVFKEFVNLTNETPVKPHRYEWIMGDSTDSGKNPRHRFHQVPGWKEIKLITHHFGCTDTFTHPDSFYLKAPFSWPTVQHDPCGPTEVKFLNDSRGADSFNWILPPVDGRTESLIRMTLNPGNYQVGIASYNKTTGCRDTSYAPFSIFANPEIKYTTTGNLNCPPNILNVNLSVKGADNDLLVEAAGKVDYKQFVWRMGYDSTWYYYNYSFSNLPSVFDLNITATNHHGCSTIVKEHFSGKGPKADGSVSSEGTCFPFKLTLTDNNFGLDALEHYWLIGGNGPIPVTGKVMTINLEEKYQGKNDVPVYLKAGRDSCWDMVTFNVPVSGFDATIGVVSSAICNQIAYGVKAEMMPDTFTNLVYQFGINGKWSTEQNANSKTYILAADAQTDTVRVRIKHPDGCITGQSQLLFKPKGTVEARFTADTTGSPCPPLFVNFKDKSSATTGPISSWLWDLGDGSTSVKQNPDKMYLVPGKYSVTLTVTDRKGCRHTSMSPDFIVIEGPKATKLISPLTGCVPLKVNYSATSPELVAFKWDLGDGNVTFDHELTHEYKQPGTFIPLLTVSDSFGCSYTMPRTDTIRTYSFPAPTFIVSGICAGDTVSFLESSDPKGGKISGYYWDFGDGEKDTGTGIRHVYAKGGDYIVQLNVSTENGCADSISRPLKFYGGKPLFALEATGLCYKDSIAISNLSTADTTILSYIWKFGDSIIVRNQSSFYYKPGKPGVFPVTLVMNTAGGCSFSKIDSVGIVAADTFPLDQGIIKRISVLDDVSADLKIVSNPEPFLSGHSVWLQNATGGFNCLANFGKNDSLFEIKKLNTLEKSYCMIVMRENFCKTLSPPDTSLMHCTVELKAVGDTMRNLLRWSPYIGWDNIDRYEIYARLEDRPDFEYLGQVQAPQTDYVDTAFACFARKRYHIQAIEQNGFNESSWSDTASAAPLSGYKMVPPEVWRASVENDDHILLEWVTPYKNVMPLETFEVYRSEEEDGPQQLWKTFDANVFQQSDMKVKVDKSSYLYKVRAMDTCKVWTPLSTHGKTMVLNVGYNRETFQPELAWSSYSFWNEGVDYYLVERQQADGGFTTIARTMTNADTTYKDDVAIEQCNPFYCYRVTAVRSQPANFPDSSHTVISHSNVDCAGVQSTIFAPNAFTMNQDGLNEIFKPRGMFLKKYELNIYNRWGERLYTTTECLKGWDGRYLDEQCQSGTYLYIINAVGADDVVHTLKGTVHLLD